MRYIYPCSNKIILIDQKWNIGNIRKQLAGLKMLAHVQKYKNMLKIGWKSEKFGKWKVKLRKNIQTMSEILMQENAGNAHTKKLEKNILVTFFHKEVLHKLNWWILKK